MGLVHTPRTLASIAKGLWKSRQVPNAKNVAIGLPHVYTARLGVFDVDYLGHMNNAAYLTHAELARWELTAYSGMLSAMYRNSVNYFVVGTAIRYRKEIRPILRRFQIDTEVCGLDDRNLFISHKFRLPANDKHPPSRVMAQMIVQGVAVQGKDIINPIDFLKIEVGIDSNLLDSVVIKNINKSDVVEQLMEQYLTLDETFKKAAAEDDKKYFKN